EQAEALQPSYAHAVEHLDRGRWREATEALERLVAEMPEHTVARQALDRARLRGAEAARREDAERARQVADTVERASERVATGDPQQAIETLTAVVEENPSHARALQLLAEARGRLATVTAEANRASSQERDVTLTMETGTVVAPIRSPVGPRVAADDKRPA